MPSVPSIYPCPYSCSMCVHKVHPIPIPKKIARNHAVNLFLDSKIPKFKCRVHWFRLYIITLLPHYSHRPVQWNSPKNTAKPGANWTPQPMAATTGAGYRPMVSFAYSNSTLYCLPNYSTLKKKYKSPQLLERISGSLRVASNSFEFNLNRDQKINDSKTHRKSLECRMPKQTKANIIQCQKESN